MSDELAKTILGYLADPFRYSTLDEEECGAVALAARGATYAQIGKALGVTKDNAGKIVQRAVRKLGLESKFELPKLVIETVERMAREA